MRTRVSGTLTLDGSGNGALDCGVPTGRLRGLFIDLGAGLVSCPFVLTNQGRTIVGATITADKFYNIGELITKVDGTASTSYDPDGAVVHGNLTLTVTGGTAAKTLTYTAFVE